METQGIALASSPSLTFFSHLRTFLLQTGILLLFEGKELNAVASKAMAMKLT